MRKRRLFVRRPAVEYELTRHERAAMVYVLGFWLQWVKDNGPHSESVLRHELGAEDALAKVWAIDPDAAARDAYEPEADRG